MAASTENTSQNAADTVHGGYGGFNSPLAIPSDNPYTHVGSVPCSGAPDGTTGAGDFAR